MIAYSRGRGILDNRPVQRQADDWPAFVQTLEGDRAVSKDSAGYITGPLNGDGRRVAEGALPRRFLAIDLDRIDPDVLGDVCMWFMRFSAVRWATHSSTPEKPRMRVLIELDRAVTRAEGIAIGAVIKGDMEQEFGQSIEVDDSTFRAEQPVFLPPADAALGRYDGAPLDVASYLHAAPKPAPELPRVNVETGEVEGRKVGAGGRHKHMVQVVGALNTKGLTPAAITAAALAENDSACQPPLPAAEVEAIVRDLLKRYAHQHAQAPAVRFLPPPDADDGVPGEWPDPILPGRRVPPEIAPDILPTWVGDMAAAVASSTQTPPALAVMVALAVLATTVQRRFDVAPFSDEYTEPLALWTLTGLPSGTRKTAVINAMAGPLVAWEKLQRDRLRDDIARVNAQRAVAKKRMEKLLVDAGKAKDNTERKSIEAEIQREEVEAPAELRAPRLFTGDCTAERLQQLLVEHGERMAVLSDEAGIFLIMAGVYSGGVASLDVFLQGHAGTAMRVDRAGRLAHVDKPSLSFGLALQPGVLADVAGNRRFRDSGLLARFLFALPPSNVGQRDVRLHRPVPEAVRDMYHARLHTMLEGWGDEVTAPTTLHLAPEARECWLELADKIERQQGEGGRLESINDWTSKLPGATARIAAVLALAEHGPALRVVPLASMERAVRLAHLLVPHAQHAFALLGADGVDADAAAVLKWVQAGQLQEFTRHQAQKAQEGRFRSVERLKKAMERLEAQDVVRERKRPNRGAPPSTVYVVNPKVHR
jgi:replicative DNA helicase